jgi:predicted nucleic acid-binding protein
MGLILDSSVLITAKRSRQTVAQLLKQVLAQVGDQETALSSIALVELVHGIHRANTPRIRARREAFIQELLADVPVYPFTHKSLFLPVELTVSSRARA